MVAVAKMATKTVRMPLSVDVASPSRRIEKMTEKGQTRVRVFFDLISASSDSLLVSTISEAHDDPISSAVPTV